MMPVVRWIPNGRMGAFGFPNRIGQAVQAVPGKFRRWRRWPIPVNLAAGADLNGRRSTANVESEIFGATGSTGSPRCETAGLATP
jgi:hypothetical protein